MSLSHFCGPILVESPIGKEAARVRLDDFRVTEAAVVNPHDGKAVASLEALRTGHVGKALGLDIAGAADVEARPLPTAHDSGCPEAASVFTSQAGRAG